METFKAMQVTPLQIQRISTMLRLARLESQKDALVLSFTNGRSNSRSDLTYSEALEMIKYLQAECAKVDSANQMRRKMIAKCHNMDWEPAVPSLDQWCREKGYLKKPLMEYTAKELPKLVSQLDKVYLSVLKRTRREI